MENRFQGVVIRATGSWYEVLAEGKVYNCRIRGRLRLKGVRSTSPVVVGDTVHFEEDSEQNYVINDIEQRRNYIIRRATNLSKESHLRAANIDRAIIVATLFSPTTATEFIDRFLVTCEAYKIPATIILAKVDLARSEPEMTEEFIATYRSAGYEVIEVSATQGIGLEKVKELLRGNTTLISGNSGVGKSTLIGAIEHISISRLAKSHRSIIKVSTPRHSRRCTHLARADISSTPPASRASGCSISRMMSCGTTTPRC